VGRLNRILVPVDFSSASREAMELALYLMDELGSHVAALHVWTLPVLAASGDVLIAFPGQPHVRATDWMEKQARDSLLGFLGSFGELADRVERRLESGRPQDLIVEIAAREGFDLIIMGTHGRTGLSHLLIGSVAERVVRLAPCPVTTVKPRATKDQGGSNV
jgi:nucleotide-binding universal stress UspA family protein